MLITAPVAAYRSPNGAGSIYYLEASADVLAAYTASANPINDSVDQSGEVVDYEGLADYIPLVPASTEPVREQCSEQLPMI